MNPYFYNLAVANVYIDPLVSVIANDIILTFELRRLSESHSNLIVAGDFNFPSISWPLKSILLHITVVLACFRI